MIENNVEVPVIFIHIGSQEYLKIAIESAQNHNNEVHLIGDINNNHICENHYLINDYNDEIYEKFLKLYKHMSTNTEIFELNCFKRYFILSNFMKQKKLKNVYLIDSDVLTYINYSKLNTHSKIAGLCIPRDQLQFEWVASPHISYWTIDGLNKFIDFIISIYEKKLDILKEKYEYHIEYNKKGGICDMTLLYLWSIYEKNIFNILESEDGIFDLNLNTSNNLNKNEFKFNKLLRVKKFRQENGITYFKSNNKYKQVNAIHFQGKSKAMMRGFYENSRKKIYYRRIKSFIEIAFLKLKDLG